MTDGIHIPHEVAEAEGVPKDLDSNVVGPYRFPDPRRRKIAAWIYVGLAVVLAAGALMLPGMWAGAAIAAALAAWHFLASWPLVVQQEEALEEAARLIPFAVGHASAAVTFAGWRSRPQWHVVVYSADDPPTQRALVRLDAVDGRQVAEVYVEDVPEG